MKLSNLSKTVGASVLCLSLVTLPSNLPAFAQATSPDTTGNPKGDPPPTQENGGETGDRDFDWGWLGLLGLAGLAGLAGNKRREPTVYRDPIQ